MCCRRRVSADNTAFIRPAHNQLKLQSQLCVFVTCPLAAADETEQGEECSPIYRVPAPPPFFWFGVTQTKFHKDLCMFQGPILGFRRLKEI